MKSEKAAGNRFLKGPPRSSVFGGTWVARCNVARWKQGAPLDIEYLAHLGPTAWPELIQVARTTQVAETRNAVRHHLGEAAMEGPAGDWRAFQWQHEQGHRELMAFLHSVR